MKKKEFNVPDVETEPGTIVLKGAVRASDPEDLQLAAALAEHLEITELRTADSAELIHASIRKYRRAENSEFLSASKAKEWMRSYLAIKVKELEIVLPKQLEHIEIADYYRLIMQVDLDGVRNSIIAIQNQLAAIDAIEPAKFKGDFLINRLAHDLLIFRKNLNLSTGYTDDNYGDSVGSCVEWLTKAVNQIAKRDFSHSAIKERLKKIRKDFPELK